MGRSAELIRWVVRQVARSLDPAQALAAPRRVYLEVPGPVLVHSPARVLERIPSARRDRVVALIDEDWLVQHPGLRGVDELVAAGFSVAVNRFGAAHGSLNLLARHPFESVWVDERLVHGLAEDATRRAELAGVAATASTLGQRVVVHQPRRTFDARVVEAVGGIAVVRPWRSVPSEPGTATGVDAPTQPIATVGERSPAAVPSSRGGV